MKKLICSKKKLEQVVKEMIEENYIVKGYDRNKIKLIDGNSFQYEIS